MKKISKIMILLLLTVFICFTTVIGACSLERIPKIELSFDSNAAYFSSSKLLEPINGDTLSDTDIYEQAQITLNSSVASKMKLSLVYCEGQSYIEKLIIAVNGNIFEMSDGAVIYESSENIMVVTLDIKIYLAKGAPTSVQEKSLEFLFVLSV